MSTPAEAFSYRRCEWYDTDRNRPVWADVWFPSTSTDRLLPLMVMSHGALGTPLAYSWLAEYLACRGIVVLGVSHYGESPVYGPETVDPSAVTRLWMRPGDCTFALTQILAAEELKARIDPKRIGALGHSSGGATAIALGGATFDPMALSAYCQSRAAQFDRGCHYGRSLGASPLAPPEASASYRDSRIGAIVALDPAAGPGYSGASLALVRVPVLLVGSKNNDFLPFEQHAGRYASLLPRASLITLDSNEGHFVYLNVCTSDRSANGVPLCIDREGVDREAVHARLAPEILEFLHSTLFT